MANEVTGTCGSCGASIYRQHVDSGIARYEEGQMLCPHCVNEFESKRSEPEGGKAMETIALDGADEDLQADVSVSKFKTDTDVLGSSEGWSDTQFKRAVDPSNPGATRCRTFRTKLNDGAVAYMNNQINEWLDRNPEILIKFSTSTVGVFEGKHPEPNLIITVFY